MSMRIEPPPSQGGVVLSLTPYFFEGSSLTQLRSAILASVDIPFLEEPTPQTSKFITQIEYETHFDDEEEENVFSVMIIVGEYNK